MNIQFMTCALILKTTHRCDIIQPGGIHMRKFRILKNYVEIRVKNQHEIVEGCSISCEEPELIAVFDTLAEAEAELKKYSTSVHYTPHTVSYYAVTEYCIEICECDEDGEFESGSDYIFTEMPDLDGVLI